MKLKALRWDGTCVACSAPTPAKEKAWWDDATKKITCARCRPVDAVPPQAPTLLPPPQPINVGVAGLSAQQQHARRLDRHRQRAAEHGDVSAPVPQHVDAWEKGADGEQRLGGFLDASLAGRAIVLHDRKVPGTRGNIDHIAISSNGVWVIDAKNYTGGVEVRPGSWINGTSTELYVNRRRRTERVEAMTWQCDAVRKLTEPLGLSVPVFAMLCFTNSEWPLFSKAQTIDGVWIAWPEKAVQLVGEQGHGDEATINAVAQQISCGLPATAPA